MVGQRFQCYGLGRMSCIRDLHTTAGQQVAVEHPLWPGGPAMKCLIGDAMPSLPAVNDPGQGTTVWDPHLTNYNPQFWAGLLKPREGGRLFDTLVDPKTGKEFHNSTSGVLPGLESSTGAASSSAGSGVLPGPRPGTLHPYIGHDADTRSLWLQWHGTHVYSALTALACNSISRSEAHKITLEAAPTNMTKNSSRSGRKPSRQGTRRRPLGRLQALAEGCTPRKLCRRLLRMLSRGRTSNDQGMHWSSSCCWSRSLETSATTAWK